jgi:hypothetical protein
MLYLVYFLQILLNGKVHGVQHIFPRILCTSNRGEKMSTKNKEQSRVDQMLQIFYGK